MRCKGHRIEELDGLLQGQRAAAAKDAPPPHFASMGTEAAATSHDDAQDAEAATAAAQFAGGEERALASSEGARQVQMTLGAQPHCLMLMWKLIAESPPSCSLDKDRLLFLSDAII